MSSQQQPPPLIRTNNKNNAMMMMMPPQPLLPTTTTTTTTTTTNTTSIPQFPGASNDTQPFIMPAQAPPPPLLEVVIGYSCYISNISRKCEDVFIKELFGAIDGFLEWKGVTDPITGKCRGFGFVKFKTPIQFRRAIKILDGFEIDGKKMKVKVDGATKFRLEQAESQNSNMEDATTMDSDKNENIDKKLEDNDNNNNNNNNEKNQKSAEDIEKDIMKKISILMKEREKKMSTNNMRNNRQRGGYNNNNNNNMNSNGKRGRSNDGLLENEVKKRKQQRTMEEKRKMVKALVHDFYGKIDSAVVTFLMDKVLKSSSYGMKDPSIKEDLELLFATDLPWVLERLKDANKT